MSLHAQQRNYVEAASAQEASSIAKSSLQTLFLRDEADSMSLDSIDYRGWKPVLRTVTSID